MKAELYFPSRAELGEGPVWFDGTLWWVDITVGSLNRLDPVTRAVTSRFTGAPLGAAVPSAKEGEWVVARESGFGLLDWKTGRIEHIGNPETGKESNRYNDGKCDPQGRFWAGTLHYHGTPEQAGLHCLTAEKEMRTALNPVSLSNGLGWTRDGTTMYYIDTIPHHVHAFDFDGKTGTISNGRIFLKVSADLGHPDGMCMDENDNLWIALWSGSGVICVDGKTGKILDKVEADAKQTSSCCFGGENLDELYITSAWQGMGLKQRLAEPNSGSIFRAKPGVRGLPVSRFGAG